MKNLILALATLLLGHVAQATGTFCIEKAEIKSVDFYYGNLLKVTTVGPEYILMTQGCEDLSAADYFELKSTTQGKSSICKLDSVVLYNEQREPYSACSITEVLKEER